MNVNKKRNCHCKTMFTTKSFFFLKNTDFIFYTNLIQRCLQCVKKIRSFFGRRSKGMTRIRRRDDEEKEEETERGG